MEHLKRALERSLAEASFDLDGTAPGGGYRRSRNQCVSASQLREFCVGKVGRAVEMRVRPHMPKEAKSRLADALRAVLGRFIDPETDRIGHAMPVTEDDTLHGVHRPDGLVDREFVSSLQGFADALVQAAAIAGIQETTQLLADWVGGKPVMFYECTVLNDVHLDAAVAPSEELQLVPLGLTTTELPRLPISRGTSLSDYLGLTLLKLPRSAAPALFRPGRERTEQVVRSDSAGRIALNHACEALSLLANCHISPSVVWHDYPDAAPFCLGLRESWSYGGSRPRPMKWKELKEGLVNNEVTLTPADDARFQHLDRDKLRRVLQALAGADKKLRIAIDRWRLSMPGQQNLRLVDQYVDLRIALEALFLKDSGNARGQEMRFRLSLWSGEPSGRRCWMRTTPVPRPCTWVRFLKRTMGRSHVLRTFAGGGY